MELVSTQCCGLKEYTGLADDPAISLETMCRYRYDMDYKSAFILFTDPVINGRGIALKNLIVKLKVGIVVETEAVENHNTGKMLVAYIFTPNDTKLRKWLNALPEPDFKVGDKIVALDNDHYSITRNGWTGAVTEVMDRVNMRVTGEGGIFDCEVAMAYFRKSETAP